MTTIPVFFATDDFYAPYLSVAVRSLIDHASAENTYSLTILHHGISEGTQAALASMATTNVSIDLFPIRPEDLAAVSTDDNKLRYDYVTVTIYFRLFIAEMFTSLNKALYIDADTVINSDVAELFDMDLQGNLVAAVHDNFISANPETTDYVTEALGIPVTDYVNSGVLLMDLDALRRHHFADHFTQLLNTYHVQSIAADQDYLNVMCHNNILKLDPAWNTMMAAGSKGPENPKIIHYNLFGKPWNYRDAPNADYFWKYAPESPFYEQLVSGLEKFDASQVESDERKKAGLMAQAVTIPSNPVTFSKLARTGVKVGL